MTTLAGKIALASIEAGKFTADKTNREQGYDYISADQVLSRAGDALARNGVVIIPRLVMTSIEAVQRVTAPNAAPKSPRLDAHVNFMMTVTDGEKDLEIPWEGFGSDYMTPDKAVYKAITSGHKYFLMKLLNIGVGNEDGEHETDPAAVTGKAPESQPNPEPVNDDVWNRWLNLIGRADAVNVPHSNPDRARVTRTELKIAGTELLDAVEQAEAQAKAEQGSQA